MRLCDSFLDPFYPVPAEWWSRLETMGESAPDGFSATVRDVEAIARKFLDQWGRTARRLGWTEHEMFGCGIPFSDEWVPGLVWEIGPGEVVGVTARSVFVQRAASALVEITLGE